MSRAIKCDRCGHCFCEEDSMATIVKFRDVTWSDGESRKDNRFVKCIDILELCPDCTSDFKIFMDKIGLFEDLKRRNKY